MQGRIAVDSQISLNFTAVDEAYIPIFLVFIKSVDRENQPVGFLPAQVPFSHFPVNDILIFLTSLYL